MSCPECGGTRLDGKSEICFECSGRVNAYVSPNERCAIALERIAVAHEARVNESAVLFTCLPLLERIAAALEKLTEEVDRA